MTQLAPDLIAAMANQPLQPFEGKDVIGSAIEIPGAAGGLRDAMRFDPVTLHHGDEVVLVMKCRVEKVRFDPVPDTDALRRVQVLKPLDDSTTFIEESVVDEHLRAQAEKVRKAKEAAAGVHQLEPVEGSVADAEQAGGAGPEPDEMDATEALLVQHRSGVHADGLRDGCPECDEERAANEAEAAEAEADQAAADMADSNGGPPAGTTAIGSAKKAGGRTRKAAQ